MSFTAMGVQIWRKQMPIHQLMVMVLIDVRHALVNIAECDGELSFMKTNFRRRDNGKSSNQGGSTAFSISQYVLGRSYLHTLKNWTKVNHLVVNNNPAIIITLPSCIQLISDSMMSLLPCQDLSFRSNLRSVKS